jgi:hypothetical protein
MGCGWPTPCHGGCTPRERDPVPIVQVARAGVDKCGKFCPSPGFAPRAVQPVSSRYTDWAIPAHTWSTLDFITWSLISTIAGDQRVWISGRLMDSRGDNRKRILLLSHLVHHKFPTKSPRIEPHSPLWNLQSPRCKLSTNPMNPCETGHWYNCFN